MKINWLMDKMMIHSTLHLTDLKNRPQNNIPEIGLPIASRLY